VVCDGRLLPLVEYAKLIFILFLKILSNAYSLVSLPGLPQLSPTYNARTRESKNWLREVFSHRFPRARVMLFQYEMPRLDQTYPDWSHILAKAVDLLYALDERRADPRYRDLPLIFLCHSFGGLILKRASSRSYASILANLACFTGATNCARSESAMAAALQTDTRRRLH